ncbi:hypothetical protein KFL_005630080 [Klebsormidium nitens]|uniref:Uncharacterized protein n=1 Tax=Klebsormidium nitens TaxID=105231 RepID=A0A1Y1IG24_KLENI|nr:hypothetical protein KFL_005630080 [Klebsormidium nitens]|eukprot:GAQ89795.1 hypothetical protein KFL_005630080 [Klebsormidium nitens]
MGNEQLPSEAPISMEEEIAVGGEPKQGPQTNAVAKLLCEVMAVQAERVKTYGEFEQGFATYRTSDDEQSYVALCQHVTQKFKDCSQQIIQIEAALKEADVNRADLAETLRALQSQEKKKLHMTAVLQVLKKAGRPSERSSELREQLRRQQGHQCLSEAALNGAAAQSGGLTESQEEAEYEAAVGEATQGVQDAVTEINEKLEEIRYELADLEEPAEADGLEKPAERGAVAGDGLQAEGEGLQPSIGQ